MGLLKNGYMQLVYFSLFNGFVGVCVKLTNGLDVVSIVFFRALIAATFIGLTAHCLRQGKTLHLQDWRATLSVGLLQALMTVLIMGALRLTSVSNALFLLYTAPVFSLFFAHTFLKEQIRPATWMAIGVAMLGVFFIVEPTNLSLTATHNLGNLMALGAGIALAAMTVVAKPLSQRVSGYYIVFWQYTVIAGLTLGFVRIDSPATVIGNWWQLGTLGIVCTGIAYTLYMRGVQRIPAQHVLIVASLEPLAGTAIAGLILQEALSFHAFIGALLITIGAFAVAKTRSTKPAAAPVKMVQRQPLQMPVVSARG